jgi:asparagine synthase (glutamine-hydrolysing)
MPPEGDPVEAISFGTEGCADITLARESCRLRGARHTVVNLGSEGWLEARAEGVWLTDGQFNILHMHEAESSSAIEARMDFCLNGFLGDALLGGSYLDGPGLPFLERYRHRGRRFILQALHNGGTAAVYRMPFLDLELMRALAVPRSWLLHSAIYREMLLQDFPEYFVALPWERTGVPISASPGRERRSLLLRRARRRLGNRSLSPSYAEYGEWLRSGSAADYLRSYLDRPDARLFRYIPQEEVGDALSRHQRGRDESESLGRYLTIELWLARLEAEGLSS